MANNDSVNKIFNDNSNFYNKIKTYDEKLANVKSDDLTKAISDLRNYENSIVDIEAVHLQKRVEDLQTLYNVKKRLDEKNLSFKRELEDKETLDLILREEAKQKNALREADFLSNYKNKLEEAYYDEYQKRSTKIHELELAIQNEQSEEAKKAKQDELDAELEAIKKNIDAKYDYETERAKDAKEKALEDAEERKAQEDRDHEKALERGKKYFNTL